MSTPAELQLEGVTRRFGGIKAVDGASLAFEKGRITALIGPNGAGKTTLFDLICGFLRPDDGRILYRGEDISGLAAHCVARKGIGRLFQDTRNFSKMSLLDNVAVAGRQQLGENPLWGFIRPLSARRSEAKNQQTAMDCLRRVGLAERAQVWAEHLSYGQQKLLAIARLLANESTLLLLDEPTAGVNPGLIEPVLQAVRGLAKDGHTVVVIEHNLGVVLRLCDWAYLLDRGQVRAFGTAQEVLQDRALQEAYLGV